jgi:predicted nucleotidyltransferase
VDLPDGIGLVGLAGLHRDLEAVSAAPVDLVPASDLKPGVRDAIGDDLVAL